MPRKLHSIRDTLAQSEEILAKAKIDPLEAIDLYACLCKRTTAHIRAHDDQLINAKARQQLLAMIRKRARGVPFAYCIGEKWFYGFRFLVNSHTLIPRPETEMLVDLALASIPANTSSTIIDIGTGSGCIAITLALKNPQVHIIATDISKPTLEMARQNAVLLSATKQIRFSQGTLLRKIPRSQRIDLLVANLPYLTKREASKLAYEPHAALYGGKQGITLIKQLLEEISSRSIPKAILEIAPAQAPLLRKFCRTNYPHYTLIFTKDLSKKTRFLILRKKGV